MSQSSVGSRRVERWRRWALLPLRLIVGYGFIVHGLAKWSRGPENFAQLLQAIGVPFPAPTAWVVIFVEIFGGVAIFVGAFVMLASIPLICTMLVALFTVHLRYGFSAVRTIGLDASGPILGPPGYELNLLYIAALFALALAGPGPLSVDAIRTSKTGTGSWVGGATSHVATIRATVAASRLPRILALVRARRWDDTLDRHRIADVEPHEVLAQL